MKSLTKSQPHFSRLVPRKVVCVIDPQIEEKDSDNNDFVDKFDVLALDFPCWNWGEKGHRYEECIAEQKSFVLGVEKPTEKTTWFVYTPTEVVSRSHLQLGSTPDYQTIWNPDFTNIPDVHINKHFETPKLTPFRSQTRRKTFRKQIREEKKALLSAIVGKLGDYRPYAKVSVLRKNVIGLLNTGASVSCAGGT